MVPKAFKKLSDTSWEYRGVTIKFNSGGGNFTAKLGERSISAPSLESMKTKLDTNAEFAAFDAYVETVNFYSGQGKADQERAVAIFVPEGWNAENGRRSGSRIDRRMLVPVKIVGFDRKETRYIDENGKLHSLVIPAGEGVIEAWKSLWDAKDRKEAALQRVADQFDAEIEELGAKIVERVASDYQLTG